MDDRMTNQQRNDERDAIRHRLAEGRDAVKKTHVTTKSYGCPNGHTFSLSNRQQKSCPFCGAFVNFKKQMRDWEERDISNMSDDNIKEILLDMAGHHLPRPGPETELGKALLRFMTKPTRK
jgi:hypothetical protein